MFGTRILLESSGCFWSFPLHEAVHLADTCGLAAWLGRIVSVVQLALARELKPGPGARAELEEMGTGVTVAISMVGPFATSPRLGVKSVKGCQTFLGEVMALGWGWTAQFPGDTR